MYSALDHAHSGLRWIALLLLVFAGFKALAGWLGNKPYQPLDRKLATFTVISVHLQLVIGLILYFVSPTVSEALNDFGAAMKVPALRFFALEHLLGMVVAIAFVTIGSASAKRATTDVAKHKRTAIWFLLGLLLILAMIPWPFRAEGIARGWF
ncbi:MAG: cytochrome B [Bacteroidetes bacterium]|nr:cytochrome B [Bacteroidota bacterium]